MGLYINDKTIDLANQVLDKISTMQYYEIIDNDSNENQFKAGFNIDNLAYLIGSLLNNKDSNGEQVMFALGKYWHYEIDDDELIYSTYNSIEDIEKQENSTDGRSYNLDGGELDLGELNINNDESIIECIIYLLTE